MCHLRPVFPYYFSLWNDLPIFGGYQTGVLLFDFCWFLLYGCCCSVTQSCLILCNPIDCSMPGFPVLHHHLELAQTHAHWVGDTIQPSHLLSSPSPPAFNLSQHQSFLMSQLFTSGNPSIGAPASASVLPMNIQNWFSLGLMGLISLQSRDNMKCLISLLWIVPW